MIRLHVACRHRVDRAPGVVQAASPADDIWLVHWGAAGRRVERRADLVFDRATMNTTPGARPSTRGHAPDYNSEES